MEDTQTNYILYTDGAYSSSRKQGGVGLVILNSEGKLVAEYSRMYNFKDCSNIKMELLAVVHGILAIKNPINSLTIITDSMYVIGCASLGWKRTKNQEYWEIFDKAFERLKTLCPTVNFKHVDGHNGDKWNEYCDKLAVEASHEE